VTARRFVLGARCPVAGHDHVLRAGSTARVQGAYVTCRLRERERREEWARRNPGRRPARDRAPEERPVAPPDPDPRWDGAEACALAVAEDLLWAPCVVAAGRYASRARALAAAEEALREVRSARARGDHRDD
jgi:hypothetical protein